ncbi:phosphoglucomutase/phosphomannomutase PgmG [Aestuariispira insulae]|uniref:Phosphomannomutase n=1 Tax=Aestuariispira insulae TaxID=1461337 RepID=A0A3D9HX56_9PROT|nr:phosphomannomutase/phosphoglucomutase [Aestuariispira insulae]RED53999.1 phosphomannomutase [Aestuariispira insulae]
MTDQSSSLPFDRSILRASDIRGIVGKNLDEGVVHRIGRAFGTYVRGQGGKTVAVSFDGRLSSPALEQALVGGLMKSGMTVRRVGRGPSPMLYFATHHLGTDAGMMITGSHNPPEYNGIKMMLNGQSFHGDDIQRLGTLIEAENFEEVAGAQENAPVAQAYVNRLMEDFSPATPLTVAWDAGNGAAGEIMQELAARLPGTHYLLNEEIDGRFPNHHPDPTIEENLEQLKAHVITRKCDLGIAFDGDGDRIGVVDQKGRVVWGDQMMILFAREILREHPGATIIGDVKCSQTFFDEVAKLGGKPIMWKSGHAMVKAKMVETGALLAGEMSAHIFFKHRYYGFDDALYAAVRLLSILGRGEKPLADILDAMPTTVNTPELRFDCDENRKFEVVREVAERLATEPEAEISTLDGVRVSTKHGWWLLRASNTQAVLVARCESTSHEGLEYLKDTLRRQLRLSGLDLP